MSIVDGIVDNWSITHEFPLLNLLRYTQSEKRFDLDENYFQFKFYRKFCLSILIIWVSFTYTCVLSFDTPIGTSQ